MRLNTGIIADALTPPPLYICGTPAHRLILNDVRFLLFGKGPYEKDILYFTEWPKLKAADGELPPYLVCVGGDTAALEFYRCRDLTGFIMAEDDPLVIFSAIQSIFLRYKRLESALITALRAKAPLREIMNLCADIFQNHVILYDTEHNLIDYSSRFAPDADVPYWKEILETGRRSESLVAEARKHGVNLQAARTNFSDYLELGPGLPRIMTHHLFKKGERLLTLTVSETNKSLSVCHLMLLDYVAELLAPGLFSLKVATSGNRKGLRDAITAIIDGEPVDLLLLSHCLATVGWHVDDDYVLLLIKFPKEDATSEKLAHYLHLYERIFPDSVAVVYLDCLVLLVHNDTADLMAGYLPRLKKQLVQHKARCGVSFPFKNLLQLDAQYNYAKIALAAAGTDRPISLLGEAITEHIVGRIAAEVPLYPLCHRAAVRLYDYDMEYGTNLLLTLETYLKQNKSLKAAAAELFIHRSTMTYRLGCIKKLVKINLKDANERLHLLLSCIVLRTLGRLKQSAPGVFQRPSVRYPLRNPLTSPGKASGAKKRVK
ncbi:MAG: PucR family transcriptional regulator [Firmicutes bacterium]|nr:PucR family transcriptional regulator [Bacillota bacterium]